MQNLENSVFTLESVGSLARLDSESVRFKVGRIPPGDPPAY
jgi:hypothetical protein